MVLHVKQGYEERQRHMDRMMARKGLDFTYLLDGDIPDILPATLDKYFTGEIMHRKKAEASCALKHIYACEHIVQNRLPGALVLEDDMVLYDNFESIFNECMDEIEKRKLDAPLISFDDSILKFVPRSQRRKGLHLYPAPRDRYAGCLYYSYGAARLILEDIKKHKCDLPIDCYHTALIKRSGLAYYWCHPTIATQGTHCGLFASSISRISAKRKTYRSLTWKAKLHYKKFIYFLR